MGELGEFDPILQSTRLTKGDSSVYSSAVITGTRNSLYPLKSGRACFQLHWAFRLILLSDRANQGSRPLAPTLPSLWFSCWSTAESAEQSRGNAND